MTVAWGSKILKDTTDYISRKPPIKRLLSLPFDEVRVIGPDFVFYLNETLVCSICRTVFNQLQQDYFDAISEPM